MNIKLGAPEELVEIGPTGPRSWRIFPLGISVYDHKFYVWVRRQEPSENPTDHPFLHPRFFSIWRVPILFPNNWEKLIEISIKNIRDIHPPVFNFDGTKIAFRNNVDKTFNLFDVKTLKLDSIEMATIIRLPFDGRNVQYQMSTGYYLTDTKTLGWIDCGRTGIWAWVPNSAVLFQRFTTQPEPLVHLPLNSGFDRWDKSAISGDILFFLDKADRKTGIEFELVWWDLREKAKHQTQLDYFIPNLHSERGCLMLCGSPDSTYLIVRNNKGKTMIYSIEIENEVLNLRFTITISLPIVRCMTCGDGKMIISDSYPAFTVLWLRVPSLKELALCQIQKKSGKMEDTGVFVRWDCLSVEEVRNFVGRTFKL